MPLRARAAKIDQGELGLDSSLAAELVAGAQINGSTNPAGDEAVLVYRTKRDKRVRPEHAALEGMSWPLADAAQAPKPPLGYGCRCTLEIVTKPRANAPTTRAQAAAKFPNLQASLTRYADAEVADLYRQGVLTAADLYQPNGSVINRFQARSIATARADQIAPTAALRAVARLKAQGLAGKALDRILSDAAARIAAGDNTREAIMAAIMAEPQRGLVTRATAGAAADAILDAGLLTGRT